MRESKKYEIGAFWRFCPKSGRVRSFSRTSTGQNEDPTKSIIKQNHIRTLSSGFDKKLQNAAISYFFGSRVEITWKGRFSGYMGRGVVLHGLWPKNGKMASKVDFAYLAKKWPYWPGGQKRPKIINVISIYFRFEIHKFGTKMRTKGSFKCGSSGCAVVVTSGGEHERESDDDWMFTIEHILCRFGSMDFEFTNGVNWHKYY